MQMSRPHLEPLFVPPRSGRAQVPFARVFKAIDGKRKVRMEYRDGAGRTTERVVWPLGAFFWGNAWSVLGWCELRNDFRSFRLERIRRLEDLETPYPDTPGRRLTDYFRWMEHSRAVPMVEFDPHH